MHGYHLWFHFHQWKDLVYLLSLSQTVVSAITLGSCLADSSCAWSCGVVGVRCWSLCWWQIYQLTLCWLKAWMSLHLPVYYQFWETLDHKLCSDRLLRAGTIANQCAMVLETTDLIAILTWSEHESNNRVCDSFAADEKHLPATAIQTTLTLEF